MHQKSALDSSFSDSLFQTQPKSTFCDYFTRALISKQRFKMSPTICHLLMFRIEQFISWGPALILASCFSKILQRAILH